MRLHVTAAAGLLLILCACERSQPVAEDKKIAAQQKPTERGLEVINAAWTEGAAKRAEEVSNALLKGNKPGFSLPQLRVYDANERLVYTLVTSKPWEPETIGEEIGKAAASGRQVPGPSLPQTLSELQLSNGQPAASVAIGRGKVIVFDYWAEWCIPCKALEKALLAWAAKQPAGSVQIVRAEADLMKLSRAKGEKVYMIKKDADGKLVKVEMK